MTQTHAALTEMELQYYEIAELYHLAEELVDVVEDPDCANPEAQLRTLEPLINQIEESADILCEEFIEVAGKQQKTPSKKNKIESALRKLYMAIDAHVAATAHNAADAAKAIVEKVKHQVEKIVTIFIDFINLSLDRIMQKQHIDELKERQEKIATILYAAEQQSMRLGGA